MTTSDVLLNLLVGDRYLPYFLEFCAKIDLQHMLILFLEIDSFIKDKVSFSSRKGSESLEKFQRILSDVYDISVRYPVFKESRISSCLADLLDSRIPLLGIYPLLHNSIKNFLIMRIDMAIDSEDNFAFLKQLLSRDMKIEMLYVLSNSSTVLIFEDYLQNFSHYGILVLECWKIVKEIIQQYQHTEIHLIPSDDNRKRLKSNLTVIRDLYKKYFHFQNDLRHFDGENVRANLSNSEKDISPFSVFDNLRLELSPFLSSISNIRLVDISNLDKKFVLDMNLQCMKLLRSIERETFQYLQQTEFPRFTACKEFIYLLAQIKDENKSELERTMNDDSIRQLNIEVRNFLVARIELGDPLGMNSLEPKEGDSSYDDMLRRLGVVRWTNTIGKCRLWIQLDPKESNSMQLLGNTVVLDDHEAQVSYFYPFLDSQFYQHNKNFPETKFHQNFNVHKEKLRDFFSSKYRLKLEMSEDIRIRNIFQDELHIRLFIFAIVAILNGKSVAILSIHPSILSSLLYSVHRLSYPFLVCKSHRSYFLPFSVSNATTINNRMELSNLAEYLTSFQATKTEDSLIVRNKLLLLTDPSLFMNNVADYPSGILVIDWDCFKVQEMVEGSFIDSSKDMFDFRKYLLFMSDAERHLIQDLLSLRDKDSFDANDCISMERIFCRYWNEFLLRYLPPCVDFDPVGSLLSCNIKDLLHHLFSDMGILKDYGDSNMWNRSYYRPCNHVICNILMELLGNSKPLLLDLLYRMGVLLQNFQL